MLPPLFAPHDNPFTIPSRCRSLVARRRDRGAEQAESRAAERVRRLAPLVRRREEQTIALAGYDGVVDLGRQRETAAEELVREAEEAVRAIAAAEGLRADIANRRAAVLTDPQDRKSTRLNSSH